MLQNAIVDGTGKRNFTLTFDGYKKHLRLKAERRFLHPRSYSF